MAAMPAEALTVHEGGGVDFALNPDLGTLDSGLNTILGTIDGECGIGAGPNDVEFYCAGAVDRFTVTVGPDSIIQTAILSVSGFGPVDQAVNASARIVSGPFVIGNETGPDQFISILNEFFAGPPVDSVGPGSFLFFIGASPASAVRGPYVFTWQLDIVVGTAIPSAVPVPGTAWLGLGGLAALGLIRRRKRTARPIPAG